MTVVELHPEGCRYHGPMASLSARQRAELPDAAFAYVDSTGNRRLPIHDAAHVRNALARFSQVTFETEEAKTVARDRLLKAARRHGIVPLGFINAQLRERDRRAMAARLVIEVAQTRTIADLETVLRRALNDPTLVVLRRARRGFADSSGAPAEPPGKNSVITEVPGRRGVVVHAPDTLSQPEIAESVVAAVGLVLEREWIDRKSDPRPDPSTLPLGFVTHLLTDVEGSTPLLAQLGDRYGAVLVRIRRLIRAAVTTAGGIEVEARADEFTAVFTGAAQALRAAVAIQHGMAAERWPDDSVVRLRVGLHSGEIEVVDGGYVGLSIHTAARICSVAGGGEILTSATTLAGLTPIAGVAFRSLGEHRLAGLPEPLELVAVTAE